MRRDLLQELLSACGPVGQEDDVRDICHRELETSADDVWIDKAGNLIGLIRGDGAEDAIRVMVHMDELAMVVKRVAGDGSLHLSPLGTMYPGNFGLGPVAVLGDRETLTGVLSLGSEHTTSESQRIFETKPDGGDKAMDWTHVYVFTGRTPDELTEAGVQAGTRVCVDRSKRSLVDIGDYLGCYFMDDRALVVALLDVARELRERSARPPNDVYVVFTTSEEVGGLGGSYASRSLPGHITLGLEVGPTEAEYDTKISGGPIVAYSDAECVYDKSIADRLMKIADRLQVAPQAAVLGAFESDASHAKASGLAAQAGLLCLPTLNTHGYEIIRRDAISEITAVVVEFLAPRLA
ncbi:M42 family metallopeptidase [Mycobacterium sp. ITM-2016-00318]|uniref:M42 family metallopeptidase n=1 Tax=Mycobacterium sp. ITM-2016-00318 TaxID=2099693 RepID=UPI000CF8F3A6|nr:M20/M25/M40 family metallo-hydrolase [Mycobacterium sp. ITM-2016-00318]WNG94224.1 M20/M25/M40 family metallo-hydrolase [Mycobacterium sp. ITM-2016-00318]